MIRTIEFKDSRGVISEGFNDCLVLKSVDYVNDRSIIFAFPFHEDTPNFTFSIPEVLTLRNAIDALCAVKMLGEPERRVQFVPAGHEPTHISFADRNRLLSLLASYQDEVNFDNGARQALNRVYNILKIVQDNGTDT
ncbi:hypothetical protein [Paenibacillus cymbidii]|uniref:hypothetical protein n=1 Tax=Paenibacillus cymbidii TaxID=1639034 RepID=UPI00108118CC|nr:hypothetical protein [Paenibacillus cymbidii]